MGKAKGAKDKNTSAENEVRGRSLARLLENPMVAPSWIIPASSKGRRLLDQRRLPLDDENDPSENSD